MDPRVVAAALATCAGADGSLALDATLETSERRVEVRRREERARAAAEEERERKQSAANAAATTASGGGETKTGVERELAGARMDAAVCKSLVDSTSELRRRAMRAMRSVTDAGVDAPREAEAAAVDAARVVFDSAKTETETAAKTVGRGTARSELKPGEVEDIAERAFSRALARETARRVAVVVCGPMWLGATQADFTSMAAGAMSVYACNQSMSLFLPGSLRRGESAEDAAARRALTPSDGAVELSLDVDLDDEVDDDGDDNFGADESPEFAPLRRRALRVRVTLRPVPVAGGVMGEVNRVANETRKGLDAAGRSITSATVAASRATMDGARLASRAIGEVGKNIAGAGEWIGASVTSVASNLASSGDRPGRGDGKEDEHRVIHREEPGARGAEAAGPSPSTSASNSASSFFAGIGAAARSPFASSSSNQSTRSPNAPNQSASSVPSSSFTFDGPPIVKDVSSLTPAQVEAVISDPAVNAAIGRPSMVMKIMSDRKVVTSLRDPRVTKAYMEFTREPCMFVKYKDDERVLALAQRVLELIAESGDEALIEVMDRHDLFQPPPPDAMAMDPREKSAEYDAIAAKYGGGAPGGNGSPPRTNESGGWLGGLKMPTVTMPVIPAMGLPSVKVKIPSFGPAAETTGGGATPAAATTKKGLTNVATGEASEEDDSDSDEFLDAESD